jgi:hypothetical protein
LNFSVNNKLAIHILHLANFYHNWGGQKKMCAHPLIYLGVPHWPWRWCTSHGRCRPGSVNRCGYNSPLQHCWPSPTGNWRLHGHEFPPKRSALLSWIYVPSHARPSIPAHESMHMRSILVRLMMHAFFHEYFLVSFAQGISTHTYYLYFLDYLYYCWWLLIDRCFFRKKYYG